VAVTKKVKKSISSGFAKNLAMNLKNYPKEEYCFAAICSRIEDLKIIGHIRRGGSRHLLKSQ
jgi:hypothetical protein